MKKLHQLLLIIPFFFLSVAQATSDAVPNTLEQAFAQLDKLLPAADRQAFMQKSESEAVVEAHMSLGMFIRNEWLRSGKSALPGLLRKAGARAFDDMSSMILTAYWRYLNGKPIQLQEQGACFTRWWNEQQKLEEKAKANNESSFGSPDFDCP